VTTLFFTVLFVPLVAIRRYRVSDAGDGRYRFFGKLPLTGWQKLWNAAVVAGLLVWLVTALASESSAPSAVPRTTRSVSAPGGPTSPAVRTAPTPRQSAETASPSRAAQGIEIDRRRAELEAEQRGLGAERSALDRLRDEIEQRRARYPDGLPSDEFERDRRDVDEFNERVSAYNIRVQAEKRSVAEFNSLVDEYNRARR
jgi:hypothetical protein